MGLWPAPAPTGYLKEKRMDRKCETIIDPDRAPIIKQMFEKVAYEKWSGRKLYNWLKFDLNLKTAGGNKNLTLSNVYMILENHFYYGTFEYPKSSGNWYKGKHEPIITKELFDLVQNQTKSQYVRTEGKEFTFTKLMTCGLCGSGISAQEKFKKLKDGSVKKYIYYGCTKARDKNCKCGYLEEDNLIRQLEKLIEEININELKITEEIQSEINRFNKFQKTVLKNKNQIKTDEINFKDYVKFILKEGSDIEKRRLISCFKNEFILREKQVFLG
jgi:site-specific DNA recombinase